MDPTISFVNKEIPKRANKEKQNHDELVSEMDSGSVGAEGMECVPKHQEGR